MNQTLKNVLIAAFTAIIVVTVGFWLVGNNQPVAVDPNPLGAGGITRYQNGGLAAQFFKTSATPATATAGTAGTLTIGASGSEITTAIKGTATYNPPSLADGVVATTTVTVTGAAAGDACLVGFTLYGTTGGINTSCQISATNTALVTMDNESGVTQDNATGTLLVWTLR